MNRVRVTIFAILILAAVLAGCADKGAAKQQLLDALAKHEQIAQHTFSGSLALDLGSLPVNANQPYTAIIANTLKQATISWSGAEDEMLERREATLQFTSSDGSSSLAAPLIQAKDTLYVHVPLINKSDEYFTLSAPEYVERLELATTASWGEFLKAMNNKWFSSAERDDGQTAVVMTINDQDWLSFLLKMNEAFPKMLDAWQDSGILNNEQLAAIREQWEKLASAENAERIQLTEGKPLQFVTVIDNAGFIASIEVKMDLTVTESPGSTVRYAAQLQHTWTNINEQTQFTRDIPTETIPFTELLQFIP